MVIGAIFAYARNVEKVINPDFAKNQTALSADMGFNKRLLSKYESGSLNITIANLAYISAYLNMELSVFEKILKEFIIILFNKHIYVCIEKETVPISDDSFDKYFLENSLYIYVYEWLNLDFELEISKSTQFICNDEVNFYELKDFVSNFLNENILNNIRLGHREKIVDECLKKLDDQYNQELHKLVNNINHEENFKEKIQSLKVEFRQKKHRVGYLCCDKFGRYYLPQEEIKKPFSYNDLPKLKEKIGIFSEKNIQFIPNLAELDDIVVKFNRLFDISQFDSYEICIFFIKEKFDWKKFKLNSSQLYIFVLDERVEITNKSIISDCIVYRKVNNESDENAVDLIFESVVKAYFAKKLNGLFSDADDMRNALSFNDGDYLKIYRYIKNDIKLKGVDAEIINHANGGKSFLILQNSKESIGGLKVALKTFDVVTGILDQNGEYDGELFVSIAFDHQIPEDEFYIVFASKGFH